MDAHRGGCAAGEDDHTSFPSLQTDVRNAGAEWVDQEVQVDGGIITSRNPDDLPAFVDAIESALRRHAVPVGVG